MYAPTDKEKTIRRYLTVSEAAAFLGVSPSTLRNWDRKGKFKAGRHVINRYRLYSKIELEELFRTIRSK